MMKMSASLDQIEEFYLKKKVSCVKCSYACDKIAFFTAVEATANISWSKLEKVTGGVSAWNSRIEKFRKKKIKQKRIMEIKIAKALQYNAVRY